MPTFSEPPSIDLTAPTVASFSPVDDSLGVGIGTVIVVTFSESIGRGSGNIKLENAAGSVIETLDAAHSSGLSITGSTLTIHPAFALSYSTGYKLEFAAGSVTDLAGNPYAGSTDYSFTTLANTANQSFTGSGGRETFNSSSGNDHVDGGAGIDTVVYAIDRSNFSLTKSAAGFTLVDNTGASGTDTLQNVERVKFADGSIALDLAANQSSGETVLLLGAVLPGGLVLAQDKQALLGDVIDLFDQGYTLAQLSGAVMRLPIWDALTGKANYTNTDIANYLLTNVNGTAPDAATLAAGAAALDAQYDIGHSQGDFLYQLAASSAFQARVGLLGLSALSDTGLQYL